MALLGFLSETEVEELVNDALGGGAGVASFNARTGAVTLTSGDVTGALTYTPQPTDADLTTIAGLTATTDNFIVSVSSAWASRTPAQVRTTLGLAQGAAVADATDAATAITQLNALLARVRALGLIAT